MATTRRSAAAFFVACLAAVPAAAQLDPVPRQLVQLGWDQPLSGGPPIGYGFYYLNRPKLADRDISLRLVTAPVYVDGELGLKNIAPQTHLGFGISGGGFAYGHTEIRRGTVIRSESFQGHGFSANVSLYRRLNPGRLIPLNLYVRGSSTLRTFAGGSLTDPQFEAPLDLYERALRLGLRFGGREPELNKNALELSAWYEGRFRSRPLQFGYGDRSIREETQLFWTNAFLAYTFPESGRFLSGALTLGSSSNADRLSAWHLGGALPMVAEYPLSLPGYAYQEITARSFSHLEVRALTPLDRARRFGVGLWGAASYSDYLPGFEQRGSLNSGVGGWVQWDIGTRWRVGVQYGYGPQAIRGARRGAHSAGATAQLNIGAARWTFPFEPSAPTERPHSTVNPTVPIPTPNFLKP